jgi:integrase
MAAIRTMHTRAGHEGKPIARMARTVLKGYRRIRAEAGITGQKMAPPITRPILSRLLAVCDPNELAGARDRALFTLEYGLMGRQSEVCDLHIPHVRVDGDAGLVVTIAASKTDQDAEGTEVDLPKGVFDTDPVVPFLQWQEALASRGITDGRLIRSVDRGRLGNQLTTRSVNLIIKARALQAELPNADKYTSHGFRSGALTDALRRGVPLGIAARHGRWTVTSPTVNKYAREAERWVDNAMAGGM